ncbi:MAG: hypothetical protein KC486_27540 [Myxococcales bacterium]|nr:hypothetical protein [Myxococcales bacterium]
MRNTQQLPESSVVDVEPALPDVEVPLDDDDDDDDDVPLDTDPDASPVDDVTPSVVQLALTLTEVASPPLHASAAAKRSAHAGL